MQRIFKKLFISIYNLLFIYYSYIQSFILYISVSNEQHDKDSLNETGSTTGGTVEGAPGGVPNRGERNTETEAAIAEGTRSAPSKSLVSRILSRTHSSNDLLDHSEPL